MLVLPELRKLEALDRIINNQIDDKVIEWAVHERHQYQIKLEMAKDRRQRKTVQKVRSKVKVLENDRDYTLWEATHAWNSTYQFAAGILNKAVGLNLMTVRADMVEGKAVKIYKKV